MREIMFRGKLLSDGRWAEGNLDIKKSGVCIITPDETPVGCYGQVDPETVGQYTGITDKNGTKVFEGDVIKIGLTYGEGYNSRSVTGAIAYDDIGCLGVILEYDDGHPVWSDIICELELSGAIEDYCFEVIGNIHDNPEMIGGKEDGK